MSRLSKKEIEKIAKQISSGPDRGPTWVGIRPSIMESNKTKKLRQEGKKICKGGEYGDL